MASEGFRKTFGSDLDDVEFLTWIRHRLVNVHADHDKADFILRLEQLIDNMAIQRDRENNRI